MENKETMVGAVKSWVNSSVILGVVALCSSGCLFIFGGRKCIPFAVLTAFIVLYILQSLGEMVIHLATVMDETKEMMEAEFNKQNKINKLRK